MTGKAIVTADAVSRRLFLSGTASACLMLSACGAGGGGPGPPAPPRTGGACRARGPASAAPRC